MKKLSLVIISLIIAFACCISACDKTEKETNADISDTELLTLFQGYYSTLDGAYAEKYSYDLYEAYKKTDYKNYIHVLSNCEKPNVKSIIRLLVGEAINDDGKAAAKEFTSIYNKMHNDKDLSDMEKYIVFDTYANVLYFQLP